MSSNKDNVVCGNGLKTEFLPYKVYVLLDTVWPLYRSPDTDNCFDAEQITGQIPKYNG